MLIFRESHQITSSVGWRGVAALYKNNNDIVFYFSYCTKQVCKCPHLTCNQCPLEAVHMLIRNLTKQNHD